MGKKSKVMTTILFIKQSLDLHDQFTQSSERLNLLCKGTSCLTEFSPTLLPFWSKIYINTPFHVIATEEHQFSGHFSRLGQENLCAPRSPHQIIAMLTNWHHDLGPRLLKEIEGMHGVQRVFITKKVKRVPHAYTKLSVRYISVLLLLFCVYVPWTSNRPLKVHPVSFICTLANLSFQISPPLIFHGLAPIQAITPAHLILFLFMKQPKASRWIIWEDFRWQMCGKWWTRGDRGVIFNDSICMFPFPCITQFHCLYTNQTRVDNSRLCPE